MDEVDDVDLGGGFGEDDEMPARTGQTQVSVKICRKDIPTLLSLYHPVRKPIDLFDQGVDVMVCLSMAKTQRCPTGDFSQAFTGLV